MSDDGQEPDSQEPDEDDGGQSPETPAPNRSQPSTSSFFLTATTDIANGVAQTKLVENQTSETSEGGETDDEGVEGVEGGDSSPDASWESNSAGNTGALRGNYSGEIPNSRQGDAPPVSVSTDADVEVSVSDDPAEGGNNTNPTESTGGEDAQEQEDSRGQEGAQPAEEQGADQSPAEGEGGSPAGGTSDAAFLERINAALHADEPDSPTVNEHPHRFVSAPNAKGEDGSDRRDGDESEDESNRQDKSKGKGEGENDKQAQDGETKSKEQGNRQENPKEGSTKDRDKATGEKGQPISKRFRRDTSKSKGKNPTAGKKPASPSGPRPAKPPKPIPKRPPGSGAANAAKKTGTNAAKKAGSGAAKTGANAAKKAGSDAAKTGAKAAGKVAEKAAETGAKAAGKVAGTATKAGALTASTGGLGAAAAPLVVAGDAAQAATVGAAMKVGKDLTASVRAFSGKGDARGSLRCKQCKSTVGVQRESMLCKDCRKNGRSANDSKVKKKARQNKRSEKIVKRLTEAAGSAAGIPVTDGMKNLAVKLEQRLRKVRKAAQAYSAIQILLPLAVVFILIMLVATVVASLGSVIPVNVQATAELGTADPIQRAKENEIPLEPFSLYLQSASREQLPWSIVAATSEVATKHGTVSPYGQEVRSSFPNITPAIWGTGRGPFLQSGDTPLSAGTGTSPAALNVNAPDPTSLDLSFTRRRGTVNPGGEINASTAAAAQFIRQAWPDSPIVSDWRPTDCCNEHRDGEALDIGGPPEKLHAIAAWFAQNPRVFGTRWIIWEQRTNSGAGWHADDGIGNPTDDHFDHIHINFDPAVTSLGPLGSPWPGSSLSEVSQGKASGSTATVSVPTEQAQSDLGDAPEYNSYGRDTFEFAALLASTRDTVFAERSETYASKDLTIRDLSSDPFTEDALAFWQEVVMRLPVDVTSMDLSKYGSASPGGGGGGGGPLSDDRESLVRQIMWAKRWIESGNNYGENSGCCTGAYQYMDGINGPYNTWGNYGGYDMAYKAPKEVQDRRAFEDINAKLDGFGGDVKKVFQNHLCPYGMERGDSYYGGPCGNSNPDMGTYYACAAVLLNALNGQEKYPYAFTYAPASAGGAAGYEKSCKQRWESARNDPDLPGGAPATTPAATPASISESTPIATPATASSSEAEDDQTASDESPPPPIAQPTVRQNPRALFSAAVLTTAGKFSGREDLTLLAPIPEGGGGFGDPIMGDTGPPSSRGFIWPTSGPVTSGFGWRWGAAHKGIDIAPPRNTQVLASNSGVVENVFDGCGEGSIKNFCGRRPFDGYGNIVFISHADGSYTLYAHLEPGSITVQQGQRVERGQQVGGVGSSGNSTGPHLHFEIRVNGTPYDPMQFMPQD